MNRFFIVLALIGECQTHLKMKQIPSGIIQYDISVILPANSPVPSGFSKELYQQILESTIPAERTVYFNGGFSKTEEINGDYDYKSLTTIIRDSTMGGYLYCKAFPFLNFCIPMPEEGPITERPPGVRYIDEYKKILNYTCQKATITEMNVVLNVWFTSEIKIKDPTQAVIQHPKIDGLILEMEEIPFAKNIYFFKKYTVKSIEEKKLGKQNFQIPKGYQKYTDIDEVRRENRRLLEEHAARELQNTPLTDAEKQMFAGIWLFESSKDLLLIHIKYIGSTIQWENKYSLSYFNEMSTEKPNIPQLHEAQLAGRKLLVENIPNYKLYKYISDKNQIEEETFDLFKYRRLSDKEVQSIKEKYKLDF